MNLNTIELIQDMLEERCELIKNCFIGAINSDDEKAIEDWFFNYKQIRNAMKELEEYRIQKENK